MTDRRNEQGGVRIGIDIGGTFTDLLMFDEVTGAFTIGKTLTTPSEPAAAVRTGLAQVLHASGKSAADVTQIIHGTTLVTNALIERKGAATALVTTAGFRDAVEIGREHRYDLYDLFLELPTPLVPRRLRFEVNERIYADGGIHQPLDLDEVDRLTDRLVAEGIEAVAVAFLHSYQNPVHERQAAERIAARAPHLVLSASSEVVPEIREYERVSTTIANVYVRPLVERYLAELVESLADLGMSGSFFIMLSSGGICTVDTAARFPIRLIESGPAAGALAAARYGELTNRPSLLSFDMGGTTAKCCLIDDGRPSLSAEFEVSRVYRFKKGSGLPVKVPVIALIEIGAGGGSIARIDNLHLLKVGPDSAGADPGPVCYGRGGSQPTVTDADLVLGYLDPDFFLGGTMRLDVAAAERAIADLGARIGLDMLQTAWGIHQLVNEQMASAARMHAVEQGKDPRAYPVFTFGGAGPVHAYHVAEILRSPELIVPLGAGVTSTVGFLVAPLAFDFVRSYVGRLESLDWREVNARFAEMETEGRAILTSAGAANDQISVSRSVELRYVGQGHQITVPVPSEELGDATVAALHATFDDTYRRLYGRTASGNPIEAINWRVVTAAPSPHLPLDGFGASRPGGNAATAVKGSRLVYVPSFGEKRPVPVYDRYRLINGFRFSGPAIVEERESTTVIGPGAFVEVDPMLNLVVVPPV
ncbi:MAG: hydantoinase/oxoprolinase family protein [Thermomicrobiales bacterium]|nr:hydantoinase/oxoprolinase family protein [Thermomicrobiales bacterium]